MDGQRLNVTVKNDFGVGDVCVCDWGGEFDLEEKNLYWDGVVGVIKFK